MRDVLVIAVNEHYEDVLPRVTCPVELVWGDDDTAAPLTVAERALSSVRRGGGAYHRARCRPPHPAHRGAGAGVRPSTHISRPPPCAMSLVIPLLCLAASAVTAPRWLRIAQREHYLPRSVTRFAIRWWSTGQFNLLLALGAVTAALSALSLSVMALVTAAITVVAPPA